MTVAELIKELETVPGEYDAWFTTDEGSIMISEVERFDIEPTAYTFSPYVELR